MFFSWFDCEISWDDFCEFWARTVRGHVFCFLGWMLLVAVGQGSEDVFINIWSWRIVVLQVLQSPAFSINHLKAPVCLSYLIFVLTLHKTHHLNNLTEGVMNYLRFYRKCAIVSRVFCCCALCRKSIKGMSQLPRMQQPQIDQILIRQSRILCC